MIRYRLIAFCLGCCLSFPMLHGQNGEVLADSLVLSAEQLRMIENFAADSALSELDVPNVFTPNGDNINDYFEVSTDGTTAYVLTVFTRTGTRIFHSNSTRIFWDGKSIGGKELPEGIYYYVIEEEGSGEPFAHAGFIHLFR